MPGPEVGSLERLEIANERLKAAIDRFGGFGPTVSGEVGTAEPLDAISDAVEKERFDSIIVVTLPQALPLNAA